MLQLQPLPPGWMLKQVLWRGEDVSDAGFSIAATDEIGDVQLVISRRTTEIAGTVFDNGNRPVSDSSVIAFAEDRSRWRPYSRYFAAVRPDQQGRFAIRNLPPGEYFVAAVDYVEDGTEEDPALLESLRPSAIRVALGQGEHAHDRAPADGAGAIRDQCQRLSAAREIGGCDARVDADSRDVRHGVVVAEPVLDDEWEQDPVHRPVAAQRLDAFPESRPSASRRSGDPLIDRRRSSRSTWSQRRPLPATRDCRDPPPSSRCSGIRRARLRAR